MPLYRCVEKYARIVGYECAAMPDAQNDATRR